MMNPVGAPATVAEGPTPGLVSRSGEKEGGGKRRKTGRKLDEAPPLLDLKSRSRGLVEPRYGTLYCSAINPNVCLQRQQLMELCPEE